MANLRRVSSLRFTAPKMTSPGVLGLSVSSALRSLRKGYDFSKSNQER